MKLEFPELPKRGTTIRCVEMHTGGEPLRVIVEGFPTTIGNTVLEHRRDCQNRFDHLRKLIINEPRGHADMYAALLVPPNQDTRPDSRADFGVVFMHNAGYSTMCGHATIALAKLAVVSGWVPKSTDSNETEVRIDAPCGRVVAYVQHEDPSMPVRFLGVPSFLLCRDQTIELENWGTVEFDIAYGGAFYAYVDVSRRSERLDESNYSTWIRFGRELKAAIIESGYAFSHPKEPELEFLYGVIFVGEPKEAENHSRNICVFADGEVDRSPTGSGVSGRLALHVAKGQLALGESMVVESILGSEFTGRAIANFDQYENQKAVIPEVTGTAFITGQSEFVLDPLDPWPQGFVLR